MSQEIQPGDLVKCIGRTKNSEVNNKVGIVLELMQVKFVENNNEYAIALILIEDRIIRKNLKNVIKLQ
jgi:hypothetical protein